MYKWSKFNYIVTHTESDICILNTYTQNYRWFTLDEYDEIIQTIEHNDEVIDKTLITDGFVIESDINEIERIKEEAREHRKKDYLFLVIYTTMACNYRCSYCFEGDRLCNEHLTTEKADEIIEFAKRYCEHTGLKRIYIKWFGGEPLLNRSVITQITNALNDAGYTVRAKMYTNGRLLTKEIATELKELRVDDIYIPIDGLEKDYVRLKNCKKEDYRAVLKNIKDCEDIINIHILVNVTESNKKGIKNLIKIIRDKYKMQVDIQFNRVMSKLDKIDIMEYYELNEWLNAGKSKITKRRYTSCEAQYDYYAVINTNGDIYRCEHLTNIEKYKVGNINSTDIDELIKNETEWNTDKIIDDCKKCQLLPICMGDCHTNKCIYGYECKEKALKGFIYNVIVR
jgi:uncharacterized protein